jgi:hypothetical protein
VRRRRAWHALGAAEGEFFLSLVRSVLSAVFPYPWLARGHELVLAMRGAPEYLEKAERRKFFQCAFRVLAKNAITGDYAEFGSHGGQTFVLAYMNSRKFTRPEIERRLWAFDSFQGLPAQQGPKDSHPSWVEGHLRTEQADFIGILKR